jgi:ComF family protein
LPYYRRVLRLGTFSEPLKGLIHKTKYGNQWGLAEHLAKRLLLQPGVRESLGCADVLVPVPLHFFRQFHRGYNQAEIVARQISRDSGKCVVRAVSRVRHTQSQTHLTRQKRLQNVKKAFKLIDAAAIAGRHVVVIDDVMTTGATLKSVGRALRPARPASISALLLAVADPRGRDFRAV